MNFHGRSLCQFGSGIRKDCNNFPRSNTTNKDNEPKTGDQLLITAVKRMPLQCISETREMADKNPLPVFRQQCVICPLSQAFPWKTDDPKLAPSSLLF